MMSNQMLLIAIGVWGALFFLALGYLGAKLLSRDRLPEPSVELRPMRLRPMLRLFSEADFEYLVKQPGYRPEMGRQLRAERAKIYGSYLKQMGREFNRLHHALRTLTVNAGADRPEASRMLLEQQVLFSIFMVKARIKLAFFRLGVKPIETQGLVDMLDRMQQQVNQLSRPMAISAGA